VVLKWDDDGGRAEERSIARNRSAQFALTLRVKLKAHMQAHFAELTQWHHENIA